MAALGLAVSLPLVLTPFIEKLAVRVGAIDRPGTRKVHDSPVPCWGGLSIFLGFAVALLFAIFQMFRPAPPSSHLQVVSSISGISLGWEALGILAGGHLILLVGLYDDWRGLSPWAKLGGQIAAAVVLVAFGVTVDFITNPLGGVIYLGFFSIPVTVAWVVGVTNALNLVDGLDGLAAGVAVVAAGTVAVVAFGQGEPFVAFCALLLAAAALGFLPYNFHPARIFMGDGGSMFLGFTLASLAVLGLTKSATAFSLILPILILGVPIFDMVFAIIRRILRGQHIFAADRDHLHHRLLNLGLTHRQTVLAIYAVNLVLGGSAVLLTYLTTAQGLMVLFLLSTTVLLAANKLGLFTVSGSSAAAGSKPVAAGSGGAAADFPGDSV